MAPVYPVLAALFPEQGIDVAEMTYDGKPRGRSLDDKEKPPPQQITPVASGSYNAAAIILLSDGRRTTGDDTLEGQKWPPTAPSPWQPAHHLIIGSDKQSLVLPGPLVKAEISK